MKLTFNRPNNSAEIKKEILLITGVLGSGKTTFLINLLKWLQTHEGISPKVIVNDKGRDSNMDHSIVTQSIRGLKAIDLHGRCIGCEGQAEFVKIINSTRKNLLFVEPTGLFELAELTEIAQSTDANFNAIHLLPAHKIESAVLGTENIQSPYLRIIGVTHIFQDFTPQVDLLEASTGKPVFQISQNPSNDLLEAIWTKLRKSKPKFFPIAKSNQNFISTTSFTPNHTCSHNCTHHGHEHGHHHEGEPFTTTFSTEGKTLSQILAYLLSLGDNLVRFKGVIQIQEEKVIVDYAHGSWTQRPVAPETQLKADLFTENQITQINFQKLTDQAIQQLSDGIPSVYTFTPEKDFDILEPVGPSAWALLYEQSQNASPEVRQACGTELAERCIQAIGHLDNHRIDPGLVDYYRTQIAILWAFWNHDFKLEINSEQRDQIQQLLNQIHPEKINLERLSEWIWEGGPDFKQALQSILPESSSKIIHLFE